MAESKFDGDLEKLINGTIKQGIWLKTRDKLKDFVFYDFFERIRFANKLYAISKFEKPEKQQLKLETLVPAYNRLCKLQDTREDPFRFLTRIQEFMLSTPSYIFLHIEIIDKFQFIIEQWILQFFKCDYARCSAYCPCLENWFDRGMRSCAKNMNFNKLLEDSLPGKLYFHVLFCTLFTRTISILSEIDFFIPDYDSIYRNNDKKLLKFLNESKISYSVTHTDEYLLFEIYNHDDRLRINSLRSTV